MYQARRPLAQFCRIGEERVGTKIGLQKYFVNTRWRSTLRPVADWTRTGFARGRDRSPPPVYCRKARCCYERNCRAKPFRATSAGVSSRSRISVSPGPAEIGNVPAEPRPPRCTGPHESQVLTDLLVMMTKATRWPMTCRFLGGRVVAPWWWRSRGWAWAGPAPTICVSGLPPWVHGGVATP